MIRIATAATRYAPRPRHTPGPGSGCILVVDDEEPILKLLTGILVRLGYHVLPAGTPAEALEAAADPEVDIHLLVTDVAMAGMSGVELHGRLLPARPDLPVLYLSGYVAAAARNWGVDEADLLEKPFSLKQLADRVGAILTR